MEATQNLIIQTPTESAALTEFTPARIVVTGRTATDKRMCVIDGASFASLAFASAGRGKIGKASREVISANGSAMIAKAARSGNYKPLAEALAMTLGESVFITQRATFEALPDVYSARIQDLKNGGWMKDKNGVQKAGGKRVALETARSLCLTIKDMAAAMGQ